MYGSHPSAKANGIASLHRFQTTNFSMKLWQHRIRWLSIPVIFLLYRMSFITITSKSNDLSLINSNAANMSFLIIRDSSDLMSLLKVLIICIAKHLNHLTFQTHRNHCLYQSIYMYIQISQCSSQRNSTHKLAQ